MEQVFELLTAVGVAFGPLAMADTKLVDLLRNLLDRSPETQWAKWIWNVAAFAIGLLVCVLFQINVMAPLVEAVPRLSGLDMSGLPGEVLTGLGVGAFASFWHERMDLISSRAKGKASS